MGAASGMQGGQMRPQQPQQRPMGGQRPQQGKGPGLPIPQQGGDRPFQPKPYQPIGANNPPFNPNPVQPVPGNMPQGKGPGQGQMTPQIMDALKTQYMQNSNPMGPGAPMQPQVQQRLSDMPQIQAAYGQPQVMPPSPGQQMQGGQFGNMGAYISPMAQQPQGSQMQPGMNQGRPIYGGAGKGPM